MSINNVESAQTNVKVDNLEKVTHPKRVYHTPKVEHYGSISDITQSNSGISGSDGGPAYSNAS